MVVEVEFNGTRKTTLLSERRSALKKDLTEPTLLEISDYPCQFASGCKIAGSKSVQGRKISATGLGILLIRPTSFNSATPNIRLRHVPGLPPSGYTSAPFLRENFIDGREALNLGGRKPRVRVVRRLQASAKRALARKDARDHNRKPMTVPKSTATPGIRAVVYRKGDRQKSRTLDAPNVGRLDTFQPPPRALISRTLASNRRRSISMAFRSLASSIVCAVMTWR